MSSKISFFFECLQTELVALKYLYLFFFLFWLKFTTNKICFFFIHSHKSAVFYHNISTRISPDIHQVSYILVCQIQTTTIWITKIYTMDNSLFVTSWNVANSYISLILGNEKRKNKNEYFILLVILKSTASTQHRFHLTLVQKLSWQKLR